MEKLPALAGAVDGCAHRRTHVHGSLGAYRLDQCRCAACREANTRLQAQWAAARRRGLGRGPHVDAQSLHDRVQILHGMGLGFDEIADRAGVSSTMVWELAHGRRERVSNRTAVALDAVAPAETIMGVWATPEGVLRRIESLQAEGFPISVIAREAQVSVTKLRRAVTGAGLSDDVRCGVVGAYKVLAGRDPIDDYGVAWWIVRQVQTNAVTHGWVSSVLWAEDTIDDPSAVPDAPWQITPTRGLDQAAIIHDLWILAQAGETFSNAAKAVGYSKPLSLEKRLQRYGEWDLLHRLKFNDRAVHPEAGNGLRRGRGPHR